jgi:hypothetical protein
MTKSKSQASFLTPNCHISVATQPQTGTQTTHFRTKQAERRIEDRKNNLPRQSMFLHKHGAKTRKSSR